MLLSVAASDLHSSVGPGVKEFEPPTAIEMRGRIKVGEWTRIRKTQKTDKV